MQRTITDSNKDPLGRMLLDYYAGNMDARVRVESPGLDMPPMTGKTMFRSFDRMNRVEQKALGLCRGHVLDVGAGSGCHSLYLLEMGKTVTALDISPGCIVVMKNQGMKNLVHDSIFNLAQGSYNTILMLMNGLGICGTLDGLNLFFDRVRNLLAPGGRIIADSTDLSMFMDEKRDPGPGPEPYFGEVEFAMAYNKVKGEPFAWLYVDFYTLEYMAACHGMDCQRLMTDQEGRYLAVMAKKAGNPL